MGEGLIIIIGLVVFILLCWLAIYCFSTPNKNKDVVVIVLQRFLSDEQGKQFRNQVIKPLAQQFQKEFVKLLYTGAIEMTLAGKENFNSVSIYYFPSREICTHILEKIAVAERHFSAQFHNNNNEEHLSPPPINIFSQNEENTMNNQHNEDDEEQMPNVITGKFFPILPETRIATFSVNLIINRLLGSLIKSKKRSITLPIPFSHLSPSSFSSNPSSTSLSSPSPSSSSSRSYSSPIPQPLSFSEMDNENNQREEEEQNNSSFTDLYPHIFPSSSQLKLLTEKAKEKNDRPIYVLNFVELNDSLPNRAADMEYLKYIMKSSIYSIPRLGGKIIFQGPFLSGNWSHFNVIEFPGGEETLVQFLGDSVYNSAVVNFEKAAVQALSFVSRPDETSHRSSYSFNRGENEFDV